MHTAPAATSWAQYGSEENVCGETGCSDPVVTTAVAGNTILFGQGVHLCVCLDTVTELRDHKKGER